LQHSYAFFTYKSYSPHSLRKARHSKAEALLFSVRYRKKSQENKKILHLHQIFTIVLYLLHRLHYAIASSAGTPHGEVLAAGA
jgi:hypothetical protein